MTDDDRILTRLAAAIDAIFLPVRRWDGAFPANVQAARRAYPGSGIRWESGEAGAAERKAAERDLAALVARGLIRVRRPHGRSVGVALTDRGDQVVRAIVGLPGVEASLAFVAAVMARAPDVPLSEHVISLYGRGWVCETDMNEGRGYGDGRQNELVAIEDRGLPALVRGWLESNSDGAGRVWYRVVKKPDARPLDALPEKATGAQGAYLDEIRRALATFDIDLSRGARERDIAPLPLPASMLAYRPERTPAHA